MPIDSLDLKPDRDDRYRPQDDLFRYTSGVWIENTEIPADRGRYGSFIMLRDQSLERVRDLLEKSVRVSDDISQKLGRAYLSFMRLEALESVELTAVEDMLSRIGEVEDLDAFFGALGWLQSQGVGGLFHTFIWPHPFDPDRYVMCLWQGGLGLPDESYYHKPEFESVRASYVEFVRQALRLTGGGEDLAGAVMEFETRLADCHWDAVSCRQADKTNNPVTWTEFGMLAASSLDGRKEALVRALEAWRQAYGAGPEQLEEVNVRQPSFFGNMAGTVTDFPITVWRAWLRVRLFAAMAPLLGPEAEKAHFDLYEKALTGTQQPRPRWERGVLFVNSIMGQAVGKKFVEKYFLPEAKVKMERMVDSLLEAYRLSIKKLDWMTDVTKEKALDKLRRFRVKIGYPAQWIDYSSLLVDETNAAGNIRAGTLFDTRRDLDRVGGPVDPHEWLMTPQTVNAYYSSGANEIVFPAAILQPPLFDPDGDMAANFGGIGAVIGHEIGHGFDDQGSKYDGLGRLNNWWTDADRRAFVERASRLVEQYSALSPKEAPDHFVNGELTLGENIGDLGGLGIAWKAYLLFLNGSEPPVIDGQSAALRFFLAWALVWRGKSRPEETLRMLASDPHSPAEFRCNQTARNLDVFQDAFELKPGDDLYLPPEKRVSIW